MSSGWYATYNDFGATWGKAIGAVGIAIYQSLASKAWDGQCFPSYQTIADDTGVSRPTAIKYIKKLQKVGLIEVQPRYNRRGDPSSNLYTLSNLPSLKKPEAPAKVAASSAITDTSNLSEAEIAELARKSHFVSRPKKKAVAQPTATIASNEQYSEAAEAIVQTAPTQQPQTIPTPPSAPKKSLNFGLLTNEKDQINALHLLKAVANKQEVLDELNKAIREQRIQTTAIQYLGGLVKKVMQGEFTPSANRKTEDELLMEKKQQAAERDKAAKQAIAACPICNHHGYLVFNEISETGPLHYQSAICSHDQKSKAFAEKLLAREKKGEVVTYFGKGDDPNKVDQAEAVKAIHDAIALLSNAKRSDADPIQAKTRTTAPVTPASTAQSEPVATPQAPSAQTTTVQLEEAASAAAPPQNDPAPTSEQPASSDTKTGYGFKSIGQAIESALEKKIAPTSPVTTQSETPATEQALEELTAEEMAELEQEIAELVEEAEQVVPVQETTAKVMALTSDEEEEHQLKLKIETIRAEIEQLYANEIITKDDTILRYLKLQTRVKLARARLLVINNSVGERSRALAMQHLMTINQVYPTLRSAKFVRQNLKVVEQIIEMLRRTKLSEQLLNAIHERNILKKGIVDQEADAYSWRDEEKDSPEQLRINHKRNLEVRRSRAIALIEDEHPELRGEYLKIHELLPEPLKLSPAQLEMLRKYEAEHPKIENR